MREILFRCAAAAFMLCAVFFANQWFIDKALTAAAPTGGNSIPLPILMYHSVLKQDANTGAYSVTPKLLKSDLEYLKQRGYETIVIEDLIAFVRDGTPLPEKPVMITFDDGYYNNYVYAYPVFKELGMRGVISVVGKLTENFTASGQKNANWSYINVTDLKEMSDSGVMEIQNHSYNLHTMQKRRGCLRVKGEDRTAYKEFLQEDTMKTQKLLEENGIPVPRCYTFPFGTVNNETAAIINEMGFSCTLGCQEGINQITRDADCLYRMKRFNRASGRSSCAFLEKILDAAEKS